MEPGFRAAGVQRNRSCERRDRVLVRARRRVGQAELDLYVRVFGRESSRGFELLDRGLIAPQSPVDSTEVEPQGRGIRSARDRGFVFDRGFLELPRLGERSGPLEAVLG